MSDHMATTDTATGAGTAAPGGVDASPRLDSKVPDAPIQTMWEDHKFDMKLVNPNNKRRFTVIVVGTGLAGASAAATLGELGYNVEVFTFHDTPRRGHSIAAQGGINAAKNYHGDGDSIFRLFYDTVKGGDYRSREANVYRLAQVSNDIIDQATAQGVPFAREYGGRLDNRSFGGAQVSRTFYARGQTGQQLLLGAYQSMARQVKLGTVRLHTMMEMLELVVVDGRARGIVCRDLVTGEITRHSAHAVVLATGGYSNVFFLSTNAMASNVTAAWRAHRKGAMFSNPCFTQIHPTCIPASDEFQSKLTLMSESLRNDGRIWAPKEVGDSRPAAEIPEGERDYYLERKYPAFGNLVPRDVASRNAKTVVDEGRGVGPLSNGVFLDFADSIQRLGRQAVQDRYGNLFDMYERITGENPYERPMRIYPAVHYTMGGLWVDYHLMTTVEGCYAIGEANFSDHGANRLGASALMQGLADGYFVLPYTIGDFLADKLSETPLPTDHPAFLDAAKGVEDQTNRFLATNGSRSVDWFHRELGKIMWDNCGMARNQAGLEKALSEIPALRAEFESDVRVPGSADTLNQSVEKAGRVADFFELAELMVRDALHREESCGGHFREESQTEEGEALRDDERFSYVAAWDWKGPDTPQELHKEPLDFQYVKLTQRSYK
jgi:succinate dehydrogenase / fumarate reductase, flavoprotein subunit